MLRLDSNQADFDKRLQALTEWESVADDSVERAVDDIINAVRQRGDAALLEFTERFDGVAAKSVADLEIPPARMQAALDSLDDSARESLTLAADRIRDFHLRQVATSWQYQDTYGNTLGQRVTPLDRAGLYVPGGQASYPSSVLMNAIPAKVADVGEVVMVVPAPKGDLSEWVLAAAAVAGVDRAFTIGGAQAVAALAHGTQTIPAVDKIVGPGNRFVAAAKRKVFGQVGIDMVAGPSEILIISDGSANPDWVAMDMFSQAEHDASAQSILLCPDAAYLDAVAESIEKLLVTMPRADIIQASLNNRGAMILTRDLDEAAQISNRLAPEHLELSVAEPEALLEKIAHAGAIFMGIWTCEALGDYCAGPNHVLPTSRSARFSSPLGVYDFQKRSSIIHCSREGVAELGKHAANLAKGESLSAHAASAQMRFL
ncbi:MAG: histidinol dehydrogenase [Gammaproteobacteria bacterium]|nr:MAG: histidinol dehydrogenase [Gammaproteobacteria bacterium]